ncbi:four helix bundle protein [Prosthecochloris sp. ZM]|uniref:four helix bundle protein n=1 Tax=Prosthecochloris sp. ZM TaxID=2283143 RepID=UPI000DF7EBE0|nr:four helix bundle protein [Prosthecochloris sp. ZM]RDD29670.1 four helix bundle protein [Prosthecochloris sp. ZM]
MIKARTHKDLSVYKLAFTSALDIHTRSEMFPKEERYSLTDQLRRSSRSVAANLAEAFRKRRYKKAFISKLSDAEGEAAETQVWLDFALSLKFISPEEHDRLYDQYDHILSQLVLMMRNSEKWVV